MTVSVSRQGGLDIVTIDNPPVNAASHAVRDGLMAALAETEADASVSGVVLTCEGRPFVAGADVSEFDTPPAEPHLPDVVAGWRIRLPCWVCQLAPLASSPWQEAPCGCRAWWRLPVR